MEMKKDKLVCFGLCCLRSDLNLIEEAVPGGLPGWSIT